MVGEKLKLLLEHMRILKTDDLENIHLSPARRMAAYDMLELIAELERIANIEESDND